MTSYDFIRQTRSNTVREDCARSLEFFTYRMLSFDLWFISRIIGHLLTVGSFQRDLIYALIFLCFLFLLLHAIKTAKQRAMTEKEKKANRGRWGHTFLKIPLEYLGFLLYPWKFQTKQSFAPRNSKKLFRNFKT